jgi:RimJ/RimL family protein N-acetyltransferase
MTERCRLEPLAAAHAAELGALAAESSDADARREWIAEMVAARAAGTAWGHAVVSASGVVGTCSLFIVGPAIAQVGYWIGLRHRRRGYATQALALSLELAFGPLGLDEIHALVRADNRGSRGVLRKCCFRVRALPACAEEPLLLARLTRARWQRGL